jgi:hypothetical protein
MKMNFNLRFKTQIYIKLFTFIIIGIFSLKLVNSNNSTEVQTINSPNNNDDKYEEIQAKFDKTSNKVIIDGVTYDLKNPNGVHFEEPGYKSMRTNDIIFSLVNVLSND